MSGKTTGMGNSGPSGGSRVQRRLGLAFIAAGAVLLVLVGGYYLYGIRAKADIGDYTSVRPRPAPEAPAQPLPAAAATVPSNQPSTVPSAPQPADPAPTASAAVVEPVPTPTTEAASVAPTPASDASGGRTDTVGLARSLGSGATPAPAPVQQAPVATPTPDYAAIIEGDLQGVIESSRAEAMKYSPISLSELSGASTLPAVRIRIPVVGIDSDVKELAVVDNGDSRAWETPKHIVGHIPTTGLPGESGQGWYFGHLESPLSGEGNVFGRLPDLAELFTSREESPFFVFLESEDLKFVYQIYRTEIIHSDEFALQDSGQSDITLVTCYPRLTYDYRLLVTAALVGVREF